MTDMRDGMSGTVEQPPPAAALLETAGLSVTFDTPEGRVEAVRGVDLTVREGEILGLVGESGSGKSITCRAMLGLLPQTSRVGGEIRTGGRTIPPDDRSSFENLRGGTFSMIFQDPMSALDPLMTVRRHLMKRLWRHRGTRDENIARDLLRRVGVADPDRVLQAYPHQLSGGLCQRAAIALALAGSPRLLVADEPTTALDVTIQAQVLDLLAELRESEGLAVILISHDLEVVGEVCDRVAVMYAGRIVEEGPVESVLENPAHPYTRGLLASRPMLHGPRSDLQPIPGAAPAPGTVPSGCAFAPRCPSAKADCAAEPHPRFLSGRRVRCHHPLIAGPVYITEALHV